MISQIRSAVRARPGLVRVVCLGAVLAVVASAQVTTRAANGAAVTPNYELASQWTPAKFDKAVFDLGVTPHWLETSDRF